MNPVAERPNLASEVPEVDKVMSLKNKDDFLMHGVVLQNRVFRTPACHVSRETAPMFHVKPFSPAPRCFT
jgi:hypothetical protein